jgi:sulfate/thiosulfate transport system substrate-binding protein
MSAARANSPRPICNISTRRRRRRAAHFNRPIDKEVAAKHAKDFANVRLLTVEDVFGGWQAVQKEHLANGGILDQLYVNR